MKMPKNQTYKNKHLKKQTHKQVNKHQTQTQTHKQVNKHQTQTQTHKQRSYTDATKPTRKQANGQPEKQAHTRANNNKHTN